MGVTSSILDIKKARAYIALAYN